MAVISRRFVLRDLPLSARITLAVFLCSVGFGYFSALVQLHVQQASPGEVLPGGDRVVETYHGKPGVSVLEHLITADENLPLTTSGSMRSAFTKRALGWKGDIRKRAAEINQLSGEEKDKRLDESERRWKERHPGQELPAARDRVPFVAESELREERDGEAAAVVAWIRGGLDKNSYEANKFTLPDGLKDKPISPQFAVDGGGVAVKSILDTRCCRCHKELSGNPGSAAPLDEYERLVDYGSPASTTMPLRKLAQSTHVHLLGFSMLYGLTGLIFALSGWPGLIRFFVAPAALAAQVVDVSFWWLARFDDPWGSMFARGIRYTGGVVAASLAIQILGSLFSLFGWFGKFVLAVLILLLLVGGYFLNDLVIGPYLASQAQFASP